MAADAPTTGKLTGWLKGHRVETLLGAGGIVVTIALYVRSKNSSTSGGSGTTASTVEPDGTADTTDSDLYNDLEGQIEQLGTAVNGLAATAGASTTSAASTTATPAATQAPAAGPTSLPWIGPSSLPDNITTAMVGEYGPFEQVGSETNGVYSGDQVAGGVPLFGQFGTGYFQNFGLAGGPSPNYSGPVFAPESDEEYVNYTGAITGKP